MIPARWVYNDAEVRVVGAGGNEEEGVGCDAGAAVQRAADAHPAVLTGAAADRALSDAEVVDADLENASSLAARRCVHRVGAVDGRRRTVVSAAD